MRRTGASGGVERPVDVKENGIGDFVADSTPVPVGHAGRSEGDPSPPMKSSLKIAN